MSIEIAGHIPINRQLRCLCAALTIFVLLAGGTFFGGWLIQHFDFADYLSGGSILNLKIIIVAAIFMGASAIPFVPGAEIGFGLMVMFGGRIVILVYMCMVTALLIAFLAGRFVPTSVVVKIFHSLGVKRAYDFFDRLQRMEIDERINLLINNAPCKLAPTFTRHRYLAIMLLLNAPGNSLLGGGGGIAFICGMSGMFSVLNFTLAILTAVAPVPLVFILAM
jgi:hypothetical protein